jgi:hypothetical protein
MRICRAAVCPSAPLHACCKLAGFKVSAGHLNTIKQPVHCYVLMTGVLVLVSRPGAAQWKPNLACVVCETKAMHLKLYLLTCRWMACLQGDQLMTGLGRFRDCSTTANSTQTACQSVVLLCTALTPWKMHKQHESSSYTCKNGAKQSTAQLFACQCRAYLLWQCAVVAERTHNVRELRRRE